VSTRYRYGVVMPKRLNVINIRLDDELKAALRAMADKEDRPLANFIVRVLRHYVEQEQKKAN
jgi:predicted transcriptional regulator